MEDQAPMIQHPDDVAVDRFASAMKHKLALARAKGRGGWSDPEQCSVKRLAELLVGHLSKGNPGTFEDVANFAMMLHQRDADPGVLKAAAHSALVGNASGDDLMMLLREKLNDMIAIANSIGHSGRHEIQGDGGSQPCYWQRKEWVDWVRSVADYASGVIAQLDTKPAAPSASA